MTRSQHHKSLSGGDECAALDISEDPAFERRLDAWRRIAWTLAGVIVLAALCGVLGRGWLSEAQAESSDGLLIVTYQRVVRSGAPTRIEVLFRGGDPGPREIEFSESFFDRMTITASTPEPSSSFTGRGGRGYVVEIASLPSSLTFCADVRGCGRVHASVRVRNHEAAGSSAADLGILVLP